MKVVEKAVVTIDYTLKDNEGVLIDSSESAGPLAFLFGADNVIPGLEEALLGKSADDHLEVNIAPEKAYGERQEDMQQQVPKEMFAGIENIEVGMQFQSESEQGPVMVSVVAIEDEMVTVDGNHPLAGVHLNFDVTIRDVREATEEELEHGHVHGEGGHQH